MQVKVLMKFIDRKAGVVRQPGEVFECSKERYDEIVGRYRLIAPVEETQPEINLEEEETVIEAEPEETSEQKTDGRKSAKAKKTVKKN